MAKKVFVFCIVLILSMSIYAQIPDAFNYQAVIRNASDEILSNQDVGIRISIYEGNNPGTNLFSESHSVTTDTYGVISVGIGNGTLISGNFLEIDWTTGNKYLKVEVDEAGGSSYTNMGMAKLLSVPYALSSKSAENLGANNIYTPGSDTLFVVKDYDGNVVFAVFPDGAAVYVNETVKGKVGGFAVSGRSPNKATEEEYLVVTVDSTRIYYKDTIDTKGKVGGFAISGRSPNKGSVTKLMDLTKKNYFIGHEAGINTTSGLYNTFFGYYAGYNNDIGYNNIFIGDSAGYSNSSGNDNIFMGFKSGWSNTFGYRNVFIGSESGLENISGRYNVFIGNQAGYSNTTGTGNVIIGATSGLYNTDGYYNVFLGNWSGRSNTLGHENVFLGNRSGWNNTEGNKNIFIGSFSGFENELGSNNIFFGDSAGCRNTAADNNIFIGNKSGLSNTEGSRNVFIGYQSGYSNQSGNNNVFFGNNSGFSNTIGIKNVFIGDSAGYFSSSTSYNIFIGDRVGYANTEGFGNVIIGATAGKNNTTGKHNTFIGNWSGLYNTTGGFNLFLGDQSGWNNISGSRNVYVGNRAGFYNTEGWNNIFIGNFAGYNEQGSGKLYIDVAETDSTNTLIWGDFSNNILRLNAYVGIGTNPTSALDINGDLQVSSSIYADGLKMNRTDSISDLNEIYFSDYGQIRSFDDNHRIIFDRGNDILEFREYGKILFSTGANTAQRTEKLILNADGTMELKGDFLPQVHDTYAIGDATMAWSYIYVQSGVVNTSDIRLKTNILDLDYGLSDIMMLRPVSFNWKGKENEKQEIGLVAQEVQPVITEVVHVGNDANKTLGINYSGLVPVLIKGMQEQQEIIKNQQDKITELEKRLTDLENLVK